MKLAVNYSPQASELLANGQITFDVFKCPDWDDMIADATRQHPVYVHFPLQAGKNKTATLDWARIERLLRRTDTLYVNMHLAPRALDFQDMPLDTSDPAKAEQLFEAMLADIQRVAAHFGAERVILENVPWDPDPKYAIPRPVIEPDFIYRIVNESGGALLLDISHAHISAKVLGIDVRDYILRLPVDRLRELHITGLEYDTARNLWGDHFAMREDDWALTEWALAKIHAGEWARPWAVALEYGGSGPLFAWRSKSEVLAADVPRLYGLVQAVKEH